MGSIHSRNVHQKEVITFSRLWEEEEARLTRREEKMEQLKNKLSPSKEDPSSDEEYGGLDSWRTWELGVMNEEDDEAEGSRRSPPMKKINISIQLSFHDIVLLCICLYSVDVLCMIGCLH